ncbi:NB-ARC domain, LRR domain containing protein [Parasponia andersonii]|uniref:NB-ARC domain, LRR domain containing protein n=1 Tax=Parasponia andersonii TaxID=3476 RepID=A0A2P5DRE6_PARAD|nr:NB-ARC domain, LRR domain containing protein [Parasponia andersonii]
MVSVFAKKGSKRLFNERRHQDKDYTLLLHIRKQLRRTFEQSMADLFLSSVLQAIADKLTSFVQEKFGNLLDMKEGMEKLQGTLPMLQAVLEDAEMKQSTKPAVRIWLWKLKDVAYDAEGLLLLLSADTSYLTNGKYANKVKAVLHALEKAVDEGLCFNLRESVAVDDPREWESRRETSSFVIESDVYGREEDKEKIVELLLSSEATQVGGGRTVSCIPIIGLGGLGKTTLAQLAYNDEKVIQNFDVKVWVFVSHHFDVKKILTTVIESLTNDKCHHSNMDALHLAIKDLLRNKRFLVVLDDVWTEDQDDWDKLSPLFRGGLDGSRILITTRSKKVAFVADLPSFPYYLKELSEDACWSLFVQRAFQPGEEVKHPTLVPIGKQIVRKCGGLALAAKTLGSLMRFKRDTKEWMFVRDSELWNFDESEGGILPALKLSYSHLPLHLKRCLSFCSIFPRSYEFKKEKLIHIWMAEGLIQSSLIGKRKEPEDIGNDYFTDLEWMSLFQEIKQCENGVVIGYKMHDVIFDLLQSVSCSEYTILDRGFATPASYMRIRHSSVVSDFRSSIIPEELYEAEHRLRTLLLFSEGNFEVLPEKFYSSLKCLFVLNLSGSGLTTLNSQIGKLSHLRYLDLSHTRISGLPRQIEDLHYLQTLDLFNCYNLLALPNLTKMKNLRHLNNEGCRRLNCILNFEGRANMVNYNSVQLRPKLRILPLFVIGLKSESEHIKFLNMLRLQGSVKITHLENIHNSVMSLRMNCQQIKSLGLYWGSEDGCPDINLEGESIITRFQERKQTESAGPSHEIQHDRSKGEQVLRSFILPRDLERLLIKGYPGSNFPSWSHAFHLKVVNLINCRQSKDLPTLGHLPFLTRLSLEEMHEVRSIGEGFYQKGNERPFPELKELFLVHFPNLKEWLSADTNGNAFPNLRKLVLNRCPELTVMPQFSSLHHLDMRDCRATLLDSFRNLTSLETLVIEGIKDLSCFLGAFPISNPLLRNLAIKSCHGLSFLPADLGNLTALKTLVIRWCGELKYLPQSLQYLSALESLEIGDCDSLTSLPEGGNRGLSKLRSLSIENCNNLSSLSMEFQYLTSLEILTIMFCPCIVEVPSSVQHLSALQSLSIVHCSQLICLPEELQTLTVLHSLEIRSCPEVKVLPEWIGKLVSLRSLALSGCHGITFLPDGIKQLTALQHLSIRDCPQLQQRCRPESGEDWPKIARVPYKHIELPKLKRPREEGSSSSNH